MFPEPLTTEEEEDEDEEEEEEERERERECVPPTKSEPSYHN